MIWTTQCSDGYGWYDTPDIDAETETEAREELRQILDDWIEGCTWESDDGRVFAVECQATATPEDDEDAEIRICQVVTIDLDEERLAEAAGLDPDCDHEWSDNWDPDFGGACSHGGTAMSYRTKCTECGAWRVERHTGSQRNPGEPELTVTFEAPDDEEDES